MLENSFIHIPSIGYNTERKIWKSGILTAKDFLNAPPDFLIYRKNPIIRDINTSMKNLMDGNANFFYRYLPSNEHWRIFKEFQNSAAYIDIETTGLSSYKSIITTIALYDGKNIKYYIRGENLNDFINDISEYKVIITYNGKAFDIPFIERYFRKRVLAVHIDLRYILYSLGYHGGLKSCETQLGIGRTKTLRDIDGFFAVLLWKDYNKRKNIDSLETLLCYNIEDVLNLEYLMVSAYNQKLSKIPINLPCMDIPVKPDNPFRVNDDIIFRLQYLHN